MPFDTETVSSLPQVIAQRNGPLSLAPAQHLPMWLPGFTAPDGWTPTSSGDVPTTQMIVRRLDPDSQWDGCEILNLYRVPGEVPRDVVFADADRALRDGGARDILTTAIGTPASDRMITARVTGVLDVQPRPLWAQYSYYVVHSAGGTALIEQVIMVGLDVLDRLGLDVQSLSDALHRSVLASIEQSHTLRADVMARYGAPATDGPSMSVLRVNYVTDFYYGDPAVVVTLDGAGVVEMLSAVQTAVNEGSSMLEHDGVVHRFRIEAGAADIDLQPSHTVWRVDAAKAVEIGEYLKTLVAAGSGHQYVDMVTPAETLILSRDEYVGIVFPWEQPD